MKIKSTFLIVWILSIAFFLFGFTPNSIREMEDLRHYGEKSNFISTNCKPEHELGSPLVGMNQIGFFDAMAFPQNPKKSAEFILWMKKKFEQIGHVIILDHVNGIDFTGVSKGGFATLGGRGICVHDFKSKRSTYMNDIEQLNLTVSASIRMEETKKFTHHQTIWEQEMYVDASKEGNVEIGFKDLIENLIDDFRASNVHYKEKPAFYLCIDTGYEPELKKYLEKYISPPLTTIVEEASQNSTDTK